MQDAIARLRDAVTAQGLVPGEAKKKRGRAAVTLVWLRPEPVTLRAVADGVMLEAYLPFVLPGGRLHRRVKVFLSEAFPDARSVSRLGHLSIVAGDLARALAVAGRLREMLVAEWPDYARGVFADVLT